MLYICAHGNSWRQRVKDHAVITYLAPTVCTWRLHDFLAAPDEVLYEPIGNPRLCMDQRDAQMNAVHQSPQNTPTRSAFRQC